MMRIAISNLSWNHSEDKEIVPILKKYGVKGIEIAPTKVWVDPVHTSVSKVMSYKNWWEKNGITITSITSLLFGHPELSIFTTDSARKRTLNYLRQIARVASFLGARVLVFGSPQNRKRGKLSKKRAWDMGVKFFRELGEAIKKYDVALCVEPLGQAYNCDFIIDAKEGIEFVRKVDHPNFRLHLDSGSMAANNEDYKTAIQNAFSYLSHFHISEPSLKTVPQGIVDHKGIAKVLKSLKYNKWACVEMPLAQDIPHKETIKQTLKFVTQVYG